MDNQVRLPVEASTTSELNDIKHINARHVTASSPIKGWATYHVRRWIHDPNGPLTGLDGKRGRYAEPELVGRKFIPNLLTKAGRDEIHTDMYTTTSKSGSGFNYIGLTTNSSAPDPDDTALAGEITSGGLARIQASTRTHTTGTNTSTIQHTFTASATHTAVIKSGLFDDAGPPVNGVMGHENTFDAPVTLQINDQLQVTWTITAG